MKKLKESKTLTIRRSQIKLNPINPKRHTEERIKLQKKNLQQVGYLGGIVWNETTGNIIDGHRRIQAMDLYYKFDGTPETDYDIKVEAIPMDEKSEKQQLTYMAVGNTKADIDLIANYATEIDLSSVGLDPMEVNDILAINSIPEVESVDLLDMTGIKGSKESPVAAEKSYEEKKQHMIDVKNAVKGMASEYQNDEEAYITLSFSTGEAKEDFCDLLGIRPDTKFIKGEVILPLIR